MHIGTMPAIKKSILFFFKNVIMEKKYCFQLKNKPLKKLGVIFDIVPERHTNQIISNELLMRV